MVFQLVCCFHRYWTYSSKSTLWPQMESCFQDRACSVCFLLHQCRRHKRLTFDPWVGKIPCRRKWQPTPIFLSGEEQLFLPWQRSLAGYSLCDGKEFDMTDQLSTLTQPQLTLKGIVKFLASSTSAYENRHSENTHSGWKLCFQAWFRSLNWCLVECGITIIFVLGVEKW